MCLVLTQFSNLECGIIYLPMNTPTVPAVAKMGKYHTYSTEYTAGVLTKLVIYTDNADIEIHPRDYTAIAKYYMDSKLPLSALQSFSPWRR